MKLHQGCDFKTQEHKEHKSQETQKIKKKHKSKKTRKEVEKLTTNFVLTL